MYDCYESRLKKAMALALDWPDDLVSNTEQPKTRAEVNLAQGRQGDYKWQWGWFPVELSRWDYA
jgi:hypothetical protein